MSAEQQMLPALARSAIERTLGAKPDSHRQALPHQGAVMDEQDWLQAHGASFVTLTRQGRLRGCIGTLEAHRPLRLDIESNAVAAALRDPRFMPLRQSELASIRVEVSLLSAPEPMAFDGEADALAQLRPGLDGILLECGPSRSTFLPQVWDQLPQPAEFLFQLKRKAGLPGDFWHPALSLQRYTVAKFKENA
jgi:AmmeMemoRadiSam system protein A